jgi:hypothetical protein
VTESAFQACRAKAHLEALAAQDAIEVVWVNTITDAAGEPGLTQPIVYLPKPHSFWRYVVALHELGHLLDVDARRLYLSNAPADELSMEAYAWAWALAHVANPWKHLVDERVRRKIGSYWQTFLPDHR